MTAAHKSPAADAGPATGATPTRHEQGRNDARTGRFAATMDARLEAFNASITFDVRMLKEDIRGSVAHVRMLGAQGIITPAEAATIEAGLWTIWDEEAAGTVTFSLVDEDVHMGVERRLRELIGRDAGRLHTGRSRNDQVINDVRLWTRGAILALSAGVIDLANALLDTAAANHDLVMPGYTHLQRGQPVLVSHHLQAYVAMLLRDLDRLREAYRRTNVLALGAGALAGVTYPIDRELTAADLAFDAIARNSMDAVADRDFILDVLYACSTIALHISRLSEEIILWTSAEFRFASLSDAFSTGSSIMPQKKNADTAELARGKSGRVIGHLVGLLMVIKGLPMTFNKDFQEDKEALFDAVDTVLAVLDVYPPMIRTMTFNGARLAAAAEADFILATDAADHLAKQGVPFREAHDIVGGLVRQCIERDVTFGDLTPAEWHDVHPIFGQSPPPLTAHESVAARDVLGGTAPGQVAASREVARGEIAKAQEWITGQQARHGAVMQRPATNAPGEAR